jgi:hypothetical protein
MNTIRKRKMNSKFAVIAVVASNIAIAGCEFTPAREPTIQAGPNAEVTVPTQEPVGRSRTFAESYGAVTLVIELRESETGEIFARVADRKEPGLNVGMNEVSRVTVTSDLKRLFKFWSGYLREGVDKVRSI